ncbi:MAG TPA: EAL domain-containing protein [Pseudolabrys sp.]|jgi:EAL domain-containing protein (putative c-di-GMP-specific phosphodiesterase class I)|nr:EAL domain-containing protein [Pseudolabrys sp.]
MIDDHGLAQRGQLVQFGRRQIPPRACVVENKPHVRTFLADILDELGFITRECNAIDLKPALAEFWPDLIVLGPLNRDADVPAQLGVLKANGFRGRIMLFGGRSSATLMGSHEFGEQIGLTMLPPLGTPFRDGDLRDNLSTFLPIPSQTAMPVDVDQALSNGWFELWYQPKISPRSLQPRGAEAVIRVRHPTWGIVSPAYYIPAANDPYYHALSQFVIMRAMGDSKQFSVANNPVDVSIHLPLPALADTQFIDRIVQCLPEGLRESGFLIEVECDDVVHDLDFMRKVASQLAFRNIGLSIDNVSAEGASLAGRRELPVVEMKVGRKYVRGCATDRIKHAVCAEVVATARDAGVRSVAEGVETQADFAAVRDLGFDLLQGVMFAKPMEPRKFERAILSRRYAEMA